MPGTVQGVRLRLKQLQVSAPEFVRRRVGSKAFEYHIDCLPAPAQQQLKKRETKALLAQQPKAPVPAVAVTDLSKAQRDCADARAALCQAVLDLEVSVGLPRSKAIAEIVSAARLGSLSPHLMAAVAHANARKGAGRTIGTRSLNEWVLAYCRAEDSTEVLRLLAPRPTHLKVQPLQVPWFLGFMVHYRDPRGFSVAEAYLKFSENWQERFNGQPAMLAAIPSIDAVRRMMAKLGKIEKLRGRVTGSAWRALQPFVRRDWSVLQTNDVWIGDGHGMKMTVRHPIHGNRFKPELTLIIDGVTRYVVGWSISFSENVIAICDALRHGISKNGAPLFYYSDNGGGQKNKTLDTDITGILPRLGVGHETGIPGNAQGRGIIERAHQTILIRVAREFATFNGKSADREWVRKTAVAIDSAVNAEQKGKELTTQQRNSLKKLPTWDDLIREVEKGVEWYNNCHQHDELPKRENGKHYTPAQYRAEQLKKTPLHYLSDAELHEMFRPSFERQATRGEVKIFNNIYFSQALSAHEGEKVIVAVDIHDASKVIVRKMDGTFICDAEWDGNKRAAFPVSMADDAREKRGNTRAKNVERKLEQIEAERNPHRTIEHAPDFSLLGGLRPAPEPEFVEVDEEPVFFFPSERAKWEEEQRRKKAV
ncbi:Mu transposase C-terminal domain-containing protein [Lelliottia sp. SL45]|uniref:Mu transposase C-terminal domain-containing protein n=1 Tax=Lelliottia sp. SL45 TaxID=2994665 RepID=UPI0022754DED|nr:Mu transposase C-terminal domain-containing protein [Lelliottia sp. SL45]MCY1697176.1 Mu transposase C-terminal domain-containing protein [Lelliottia sp. SL45]